MISDDLRCGAIQVTDPAEVFRLTQEELTLAGIPIEKIASSDFPFPPRRDSATGVLHTPNGRILFARQRTEWCATGRIPYVAGLRMWYSTEKGAIRPNGYGSPTGTGRSLHPVNALTPVGEELFVMLYHVDTVKALQTFREILEAYYLEKTR
jgi:hypothetical protein